MTFENLLFRTQYAALIITNLFVALYVINTYHRSGRKERALFLTAIAAALGAVSAVISFAMVYARQTNEAKYLSWVFVCLLTIFDSVLWAYATSRVVKRFTTLQESNEK